MGAPRGDLRLVNRWARHAPPVTASSRADGVFRVKQKIASSQAILAVVARDGIDCSAERNPTSSEKR